jgi:hypothetical protein
MLDAAPLPRKTYSLTLSTIFGLALIGGLAGPFSSYDAVPSLREQRALASFLSLADLAHPTLIPARITAFFSDNFGGRKLLIREYFRFRLKILQSDVGMNAILGTDNSLILPGEIPTYRHEKQIEPAKLDRMRRLLNSWCIYARDRNAAFVFVIGPNKTTIQPVVPDYLSIMNRPSVIDRVYSLPLDCPAIKVDLREPLRRHAGELLYYKWGTHWNNQGALIMWRAIKQAIDERGPKLSWPVSDVVVTTRPAIRNEDSMWAWYGQPDPEEILLKQYAFNNIRYEGGAAAPPRARILALGDSFLLWAAPTASEVMGSYTLWPLSPLDQFTYKPEDLQKDGWILAAHPSHKRVEIMDIFRPNVVILEIVERSIDELADFQWPPRATR